jgi:hypothetical protein
MSSSENDQHGKLHQVKEGLQPTIIPKIGTHQDRETRRIAIFEASAGDERRPGLSRPS